MQTDRLALTLIFTINFQLSEEEKRPFLQPIIFFNLYMAVSLLVFFRGLQGSHFLRFLFSPLIRSLTILMSSWEHLAKLWKMRKLGKLWVGKVWAWKTPPPDQFSRRIGPF